jgi:hypothetical protein
MQLMRWTIHREVMRVGTVSMEAVVGAVAMAEVIIQRLILLWKGCLQNSSLEVQH